MALARSRGTYLRFLRVPSERSVTVLTAILWSATVQTDKGAAPVDSAKHHL